MDKRDLYYMFACRVDPDIRVLKSDDDMLSQYMTDLNWKCLGSVMLTDDQYDVLKYFFGGNE